MSKDKQLKGPQERAAEHLKKMLRNAAVGGAALGITTGCGSCSPLVCDPMPPPICDNRLTTNDLLGHANLEALWQPSDAGALRVHVELNFHGEGTVVFPSDPSLTGATLVSAVRESRKLVFDFAPEAGKAAVDAVIPLTCDSKVASMKLRFDVGNPGAGNAVVVTSLE